MKRIGGDGLGLLEGPGVRAGHIEHAAARPALHDASPRFAALQHKRSAAAFANFLGGLVRLIRCCLFWRHRTDLRAREIDEQPAADQCAQGGDLRPGCRWLGCEPRGRAARQRPRRRRPCSDGRGQNAAGSARRKTGIERELAAAPERAHEQRDVEPARRAWRRWRCRWRRWSKNSAMLKHDIGGHGDAGEDHRRLGVLAGEEARMQHLDQHVGRKAERQARRASRRWLACRRR